MNTATAGKNAGASVAALNQSNPHEFDAEGVAVNPEQVTIPVPKGCSCVFAFALHSDGEWRIGYVLAAGKEDGIRTVPGTLGNPYSSFDAAMGGALADARGYFAASTSSRLHRKCVSAIDGYAREYLAKAGMPVAGELGAPVFAGKPTLPETVPLPEPEEIEVEIAPLEDNPHNPRGEISPDSVAELAQTIADVGLLQKVGVRVFSDGRRQLMWGHRRKVAFQFLKRSYIPARVYRDITDQQARLVLLIENGQQKALDPIQEARGFAELARDFGFKQEEIAGQVRKSRPVIANALRLLELPAGVQDLLAQRKLTTGHGTALCRFKDWPKVCEKIGELAASTGATAGSLEKNLPFYEELVSAKLAVDMLDQFQLDELQKKFKGDPDFFLWQDKQNWDDHAYCLNVGRAKEIIAEDHRKNKEAAEERENEREQANARGGSGELTPAARKARAKKLDGNLNARLQTSAVHHAAVERLKQVERIDIPLLLVVVREAFAHGGGEDVETIAEQLGVKLPKGFDEALSYDAPFGPLLNMDSADLLRLAAAVLVARDVSHAMRYASEVPYFAEMACREDVFGEIDPQSYVVEWHDRILPLVQAGKKAPEVQAALGCPEFIAVQMVRSIRRELRDAGVKATAAAVSKVGITGVAFEGMQSGQSSGFASKDAALEWLALELNKPGAAGYKCSPKKLSKNLHVILFSKPEKIGEGVGAKAAKKLAKKAPPAKAKKGGKKK